MIYIYSTRFLCWVQVTTKQKKKQMVFKMLFQIVVFNYSAMACNISCRRHILSIELLLLTVMMMMMMMVVAVAVIVFICVIVVVILIHPSVVDVLVIVTVIVIVIIIVVAVDVIIITAEEIYMHKAPGNVQTCSIFEKNRISRFT